MKLRLSHTDCVEDANVSALDVRHGPPPCHTQHGAHGEMLDFSNSRQPENSKRAHLTAPALQTPPKNPRIGKKVKFGTRKNGTINDVRVSSVETRKAEVLGVWGFGSSGFRVQGLGVQGLGNNNTTTTQPQKMAEI